MPSALEKRREQNRDYYSRNKLQKLARNAAWRKLNPDKVARAAKARRDARRGGPPKEKQTHEEYLAYQKKWRGSNSDEVRAAAKVTYQESIRPRCQKDFAYLAWVKVNGARSRAKRRGIPFSIDESDVVIPATCPVLGIPLIVYGPRDNSPSLDRIMNEKGYVKGNVAVISGRANMAKRDLSLDELRKIVAYIENHAAVQDLLGQP